MGPPATWFVLNGVYLDMAFRRRRRMSLPLVMFGLLVVLLVVFIAWGMRQP